MNEWEACLETGKAPLKMTPVKHDSKSAPYRFIEP